MTTKVKKKISDVKDDVLTFFRLIEPMDKWQNVVWINFDEVALFFEIDQNYTLEVKGKKVIGIRSFGKDKERATVLLTATSDGHIFPPVLIFKSVAKKYQNNEDYVETLEANIQKLVSETGALILCNKKAWNKAELMQKVIIPFFKRYVSYLYDNTPLIPIFLFDNCTPHTHDISLNEFRL